MTKPRQHLSSLARPARNAAIWRALLSGESVRAIARRLRISRATVQRAKRRRGRTFRGGYGPPSKGLRWAGESLPVRDEARRAA